MNTANSSVVWKLYTNSKIYFDMENIYVIKADGSRTLFSEEKLRYSIRRAGIPRQFEDKAVSFVKEKLHQDIATFEIYTLLLGYLRLINKDEYQSRYSLKKAIMDLGPAGFTFEKYIGAILAKSGYLVTTNAIVQGKCVSHEIDVLAIKDQEHYLIECKFHNTAGVKTDVQVALYVQARFEDILYVWEKEKEKHLLHKPWIVTNTKCTSQALDYSLCAGMQVTAWGYPIKNNLQEIIESGKFYPITCLMSLPNFFKQKLLAQNLVLVFDLEENKNLIKSLSISDPEKERVEKEINYLLNS